MLPVSTMDTCPAILNEHAEKENPPTFLFECLNGRQQRELLRIKDGLDKGDDGDNFDKVFSAVELHLNGWENMGIPYTKGSLADTINYLQCLELLGQLVFQRPSVADKKKFRSPSPLSTENFASNAQEPTNANENSAKPVAGASTA